ncbi:Protein containing DUF1559 OS=Rhodopirellula maiorica SM1 GN=RMSM_02894 PE=4 SV=1: SBP_bac_10 [Gemmataceae bacterium]|nr:Protein containing DUF1559 OS=Rhodopirellula maiorica SM1 GN=RMSM_02894 PE=4 SV=1: SBP_bac_10 [Gemmataceae bacterium]VTU00770.1 Protein containing DUF1559 OS=Rhodopirellula maiorica SM1 GN=RMSM_02894 PE=4 SV=1: SBP_bac_10 [Gemmataceae bacterium]
MRFWARTACAVAAALASLTVAACGRQSESSPPAPTAKSDAAPPAKKDASATGGPEANRQTSRNNLYIIWLGICNHHDSFMRLPRQSWTHHTTANSGTPGGLSWRVHLLPQIGHEELYSQFKLGEPWDGETNKKLIEKMPRVYATPGVAAEPGHTYFKVFAGPKTPFDPTYAPGLSEFSDGVSNTICAVEGGAPVVWTKPDDITVDLSKPLPDLSLAGNRKISVIMFDGTCRTLDLDTVQQATLKAAVTPAGGEVLGPDWATGAPAVPRKPAPAGTTPKTPPPTSK